MTVAIKTEAPEETSAEKRRRLLEENRVRALNAPLRDPAFVQKIAQAEGKLLTAQQELDALRAGDPKKNRKLIKRAENKLRGLADDLANIQSVELAAYALMGEAREAILRGIQRGETIQAKVAETADIARDERGARVIEQGGPRRGLPALVYSRGLRARNLTGLDHAIASGYFAKARERLRGVPPDDFLRRVAETYSDCYVIVEGQATHAGEGGSGFKPKDAVPQVVEAGQTLADMRKGLNRRQRAVLDLVCGQSFRLREAAQQLHAGFPATLTALIVGLKVAEESRLAERARREQNGVVPIGVQVRAVNVMLRGVRV